MVWDVLPDVPLPADIVSRFDNKTMFITGFEVDVRRKQNGTEVSVPCYESYNHHYVAYLHGKRALSRRAEVLSHDSAVEFRLDGSAGAESRPYGFAAQAFSEHNGNEARQTYHGMPAAAAGHQYGVALDSPTTFIFGPMQINTRNPDGSGTRCRGRCPLPRSSNAPPGEPLPWSGILECPCTTRVKKVFGGHYAQVTGQCDAPVKDADECFTTAAQLMYPRQISANHTVNDPQSVSGCAVMMKATGKAAPQWLYETVYNSAGASPSACGTSSGATHLVGQADSVTSLALDIDSATQLATITLTSSDPAAHWYGVGFNASAMDGTYTIVVDGSGKVSEHKLGNHNPGTLLKPSPGIKVVSHSSVDGKRVTILQRPLKGASLDHFTFSTTEASLQFISAVGSTPDFQQHKARGTATLSLVSLGGSTCICRGGTGTIDGFPFNPQCMGEPKSDLIRQKNPTCDINLYSGGMACCRGGVFLLDADQEIPPLEDEIYYKWRFYFQEWNPIAHKQTYHLEWQFGHIEYDVPKAPAGTPPELAVHTLTTRFTGQDFLTMGNYNAGGTGKDVWDLTNSSRKFEIVMAGFHCHSPACLGGELYNADTGDLLCEIRPIAGQSDVPQDEESYLWLPPCQWGDPRKGLMPPPVFTMDTNFLAIKRANSTYGHYGVMAIWQGRGAYAD